MSKQMYNYLVSISESTYQLKNLLIQCLNESQLSNVDKKQIIYNLIDNFINDNYLRGVENKIHIFYNQLPQQEIIMSLQQTMIKDFAGSTIINTDIMSDMIRFIVYIIDFKSLVNIDFNNYYQERSTIFADLTVIEQHVQKSDGHTVILDKDSLMFNPIYNILSKNDYFFNFYDLVQNDKNSKLFINSFMLNCAKYYIQKNFIQSDRSNDSTRVLLNQLALKLKEGDDLAQSASLYLQIEKVRSKFHNYQYRQQQLQSLVDIYMQKENEQQQQQEQQKEDFQHFLSENDFFEEQKEEQKEEQTYNSMYLSKDDIECSQIQQSSTTQTFEKIYQSIPYNVKINCCSNILNIFFDTRSISINKQQIDYDKIKFVQLDNHSITLGNKKIKIQQDIEPQNIVDIILLYIKIRQYINYSLINVQDMDMNYLQIKSNVYSWEFKKIDEKITLDKNKHQKIEYPQSFLQQVQDKAFELYIKSNQFITIKITDKVNQDQRIFFQQFMNNKQGMFLDENIYVPYKEYQIFYVQLDCEQQNTQIIKAIYKQLYK